MELTGGAPSIIMSGSTSSCASKPTGKENASLQASARSQHHNSPGAKYGHGFQGYNTSGYNPPKPAPKQNFVWTSIAPALYDQENASLVADLHSVNDLETAGYIAKLFREQDYRGERLCQKCHCKHICIAVASFTDVYSV